MFEFLGILAVSVLGLAMFSAATRILLHVIFGKDIPPGLQRLANALDDVFEASAQTILGPLRFLRQNSNTTSAANITVAIGREAANEAIRLADKIYFVR